MQFKTLLVLFGCITTAVRSNVAILPTDIVPCTPSKDESTCLLNYFTNSNAALDMADPKISATAFIYSFSCLPLGQKTLSVPGEASILSWALSFKKPLYLGSEKRPDVSFWTPWFTYDETKYTYDDCSCSGSGLSGGHRCSCPFRCKLFVLD